MKLKQKQLLRSLLQILFEKEYYFHSQDAGLTSYNYRPCLGFFSYGGPEGLRKWLLNRQFAWFYLGYAPVSLKHATYFENSHHVNREAQYIVTALTLGAEHYHSVKVLLFAIRDFGIRIASEKPRGLGREENYWIYANIDLLHGKVAYNFEYRQYVYIIRVPLLEIV